ELGTALPSLTLSSAKAAPQGANASTAATHAATPRRTIGVIPFLPNACPRRQAHARGHREPAASLALEISGIPPQQQSSRGGTQPASPSPAAGYFGDSTFWAICRTNCTMVRRRATSEISAKALANLSA